MYKTRYATFNGGTWESCCQQCFKLKYETEGYQQMPAWQGDLGIEGFTRTGLAFQCYCPDAEYNPDKLYEEQRNKITTDLNKLETNEKDLKSYLQAVTISKWIFVVPEYKNKELVRHCQKKAAEFREKKLSILASDFDVFIHDIEFFSPQLPVVLEFRKEKINISLKEEVSGAQIVDWKAEKIPLVDNAIRKHKKRIPPTANDLDSKVNSLTNKSIGDFLNGDEVIRNWSEIYPDQFEKFQKTVSLFEERVKEKCLVYSGDSNQLYEDIGKELRGRIKESFSYLDDIMVDRLTNRVMADWILRCPIDFE